MFSFDFDETFLKAKESTSHFRFRFYFGESYVKLIEEAFKVESNLRKASIFKDWNLPKLPDRNIQSTSEWAILKGKWKLRKLEFI